MASVAGDRVALPIAPRDDTPARRLVREGTFGELDGKGRPGALRATEVMERLLDATLAHEFECGPQPACTRGCSWCCHVYVTVTAPEAILAVRRARADLAPEELDALRARADGNARSAGGKTPGEYPRQSCAFLVEGACSIHPSRPAHCRTAHSVDVDACRAAYDARPAVNLTIKARRSVRARGDEVRVGYKEALVHAAIETTTYELQQIVHLLLEDPERESQWLAGESAVLDAARAKT
jgi:Fe-S-cluster containining protein